MARKIETPPEKLFVRLELTRDYHDALRMLAAEARVPMSRFTRELVEREIDRRKPKNNSGKSV